MAREVTNIVVAGLGGQGVLKASDILADAAFLAGLDVKKSEIHGMSQRGGSVTSDVRFGREVLSPMVSAGEADYLVVLADDQVDSNLPALREGGVVVPAAWIDEKSLSNRRSINVALLGALSVYLALDEAIWRQAIRANLPEKLLEVNEQAFEIGKAAGRAHRAASADARSPQG